MVLVQSSTPRIENWSGSYAATGSLYTSIPAGEVSRDMRITARDGLRRIELSSGEVMVDTGEWVVAVAPDGRHSILCPSYSGFDEGALGPEYTVASLPSGRMAGRPTRLTRVSDADTGTPTLELWRDAETGVPLARQSYTHEGRLSSRALIDTIDYSAEPAPIEPIAVSEPDFGGEPMEVEAFVQRADFRPIPPSYVPEGYDDVGLFLHRCDRGRAYAEFRYTDGLRILSVYERHPQGQPMGRGVGRGRGRGLGRAQGEHIGRVQDLDLGLARAVRQRRGDRVIIVVGDLPAAEARRVLDSIPTSP